MDKEVRQIPTLKAGELFSDNQIDVRIKEVKYLDGAFRVYLYVRNKGEDPFENPGQLQFKLKDSKYENEVNRLGFGHHFNRKGYIYQGEESDGFYEWQFERDIEIEEITFATTKSGVMTTKVAKWTFG
ncbi:hypothetical protein VBD025_00810 [Virgibacillus flavescens]|uniref:hypothetical protein n=1 Tax=Virgibacillus flavescens TaxID=1611422 RepID=UPI003D3508C0